MEADYDPNELYTHQTWVRFAKGRTLVGVDESDTLFSTAEKTCGAQTHVLTTAQMPSHTHVQNAHQHQTVANGTSVWSTTSGSTEPGASISGTGKYYAACTGKDYLWGTLTSATTATNQNTGGGAAHNNIQPSIAVYYWKRIA